MARRPIWSTIRLQAFLLPLWCLLLACRSSSTGGAPASPTPAPTPSAQTDVCAPTSSTSGPVTDPNGPFFHQVVAARTSDGVTLGDARQVLDHASVPDGVRLADGSVRIYYVNGSDGGVWVARLDGMTATPVGPISLNGVRSPRGVVDPDATAVGGGRIRLAYLSGFGAPGSTGSRAICLAESTDGENFTVVAAAVEFGAGDTTTDPSLLQLPDGTWLMAMSRGQQTVLARSADGLRFALGETLTVGGVPEIASAGGGRVRLYVCARGIVSYTSGDGGRSWQAEGTVVDPASGPRIVCDPSFVAGADLFLYKTQY